MADDEASMKTATGDGQQKHLAECGNHAKVHWEAMSWWRGGERLVNCQLMGGGRFRGHLANANILLVIC